MLIRHFKILALMLLTIGIATFSCSPVKYIPNGTYIVDKNRIKIQDSKIKLSKLKKNAQPEALQKVLGIYALRARIYILVNPAKDAEREQKKQAKLNKYNDKQDRKFEKKTARIQNKRNIYFNKYTRLNSENDTTGFKKAFEKYLEYEYKLNYLTINAVDLKNAKHKSRINNFADIIKKLGQEPQLCDTFLIKHTISQFEIYMQNNGYLRPKITYSIDTLKNKKRRVRINYLIKANEPLTITSVSYNIPEDTEFMNLFMNHPSLRIKTGKIINIDELENFRNNYSEMLRENGYYYFSKQLINFTIDTTNNRYTTAALSVNFNTNVDKAKIYKQWHIRNVYIFNDFSPQIALTDSNYTKNTDTSVAYLEYQQPIFIIKKHKDIIKPKYLTKEIYIFPDSLYSLNAVRQTYSHLSKFKIYKLVNIEFDEISNSSDSNLLDCQIKLSPDNYTNWSIETYASRNSLNIGASADLTFTHNDLFRGGEILDISSQISLGHQKTNTSDDATKLLNAQEYNLNLKLTVPRLLIPFKSSNFIRRNNPRTIMSLFFSYQNRPEYNMLQTTFKYDYFIKSSISSSHTFSPLVFSTIKANLTPDFAAWVQKVMLQESYENHLILGSNYNYNFTSQNLKKNKSYYLNANIGLAGNLLYLAMKTFNADTVDYYYLTPGFKLPFAQYVKTDIEFRYLYENNDQQFAYRFFAGVGLPYGNTHLLPFSEKFFVGGANSIRAWQARSLGPGQYKQSDTVKYNNQTADIRLEMNLEYRFKIFSVLEGAFFLDIGNIWNINSYDSRNGGVFYFNQFYKQLAVGSGTGLRINLNYFVFRLDLGVKVVDPSAPEGSRFIPDSRAYKNSDFVLNVAFGYPF